MPTLGDSTGNMEAEYEPIAIIGCSLRLPGNVNNCGDFWDMLVNKRDGRCRVPANRYNIEAYYHSQPRKRGFVATEYG